jgi:transposase-like protein
MKTPESLLEATRLFVTVDDAHTYLASLRWPDGRVPCPSCGCTENYYLATQRRWKCKACKRQFSVKVGTIFEDSPIGLDKWLLGVWLITNAKNGISSCELARDLEVTQKTAWFMLHRIRLSMQTGNFEKLSGTVEIDETYVGGENRNRHKNKKRAVGFGGKAIVVGFLERGGKCAGACCAQRDPANASRTNSGYRDSRLEGLYRRAAFVQQTERRLPARNDKSLRGVCSR